MRGYFYHTDLGQNAVFPNSAIQIALIQYGLPNKMFRLPSPDRPIFFGKLKKKIPD